MTAPMAKFFFDTDDGDRFVLDEDGIECPDRDEARRAALRGIADLAIDTLPDGDERTFKVSVRDGISEIYVATLTLHGAWKV